MTLLKIVIRKIYKNFWLVLCLLTGLLIAVSLISSMPMYSQGVMQKMLTSDLDNIQTERNIYPGRLKVFFKPNRNGILPYMADLRKEEKKVFEDEKVLRYFDGLYKDDVEVTEYLDNSFEQDIGVSYDEKIRYTKLESRKILYADETREFDSVEFISIASYSDMFNHIKIVDGRLPSNTMKDGYVEVILTNKALMELDIVLNQKFLMRAIDDEYEDLKIIPVGVFEPDYTDKYWSYASNYFQFKDVFIMDDELMQDAFIKISPTLLEERVWTYALNYRDISVADLQKTISVLANLESNLEEISKGASSDNVFDDVLQGYDEKAKRLNQILVVLNVPVFIMVFIYLLMVATLIVNREESEISLLKSRGAYRYQIVISYVVEFISIGIIAMILGPLVAYVFSSILGSTSGFIEFAQRTALPITFNQDVFTYAVIAVIVSVMTIVLPTIRASKKDIVTLKQTRTRFAKFSFWEKAMIDFILLAIAGYGYYTFTKRQEVLSVTGLSSLEMDIDPLLFIAPTLFILGACLLLLRIYPLILGLIEKIGRKYWPTPMYLTMVNVSRGFRNYHFLFVFIVITSATGIFSSCAARTINNNFEEKIAYQQGSEIVLMEEWQDNQIDPDPLMMDGGGGVDNPKDVIYSEPSFSRFQKVEGVKSLAKVFTKDDVKIRFNGQIYRKIDLMAINPYDFGNTAWFRQGLLDYHINAYLNLLASEPSACLISKNMAEEFGLEVGSFITLTWDSNNDAALTVYGIIDYWPTYNPKVNPNEGKNVEDKLIVTNLNYTQDHISLEPYEVWMKLDESTKIADFYNSLKEENIKALYLKNTRQMIIKEKNDPFRLAINGELTLGFIISGFLCFLGFLIYWILSISSRSLQFGIFRAVGLSLAKLIKIIVWEQMLTSLVSIIMGIGIGLFASQIYVPFFQVAFDPHTQVPPFRVVSMFSDRLKIYVLLGSMMITGFVVLGIMISRLKISQILKLGEE